MAEDGASLTREPGPAVGEGETHGAPWSQPLSSPLWPPLPSQFFFLNQVFYLCLYLILAAPGLRCCTGVSLVAKRGLFFIAVRGLLIAVTSPFQSTGSSPHRLQEFQMKPL